MDSKAEQEVFGTDPQDIDGVEGIYEELEE